MEEHDRVASCLYSEQSRRAAPRRSDADKLASASISSELP
jgi:hypothetical protein